MQRQFLLSCSIALGALASAQVLTKEDSLNARLVHSENATLLSGYGEVKVAYDMQLRTGNANLTRNVLFLGHRFNDRISFFSEWELEDARVQGGKAGGEISLEQLFVKFDLTHDLYLTAGAFIPRIGITNENHLPVTFNGNDRPFVEQLVIPSTWREIGVGIYGKTTRVPGLNWNVALQNGLNAAAFEHGTGIREGRGEGSNANATNLAVSGALLYYWKKFRVQASGYYGGSSGLTAHDADSLRLDRGAFGTPVSVIEANMQYLGEGLRLKALVAQVDIKDASRINRAYTSNTPERIYGAYAEVGYDLFRLFAPKKPRDLIAFVRVETLDLNAALPANAIDDPTLHRTYVIAGLTYAPVNGICVKADYVFRNSGAPNALLAADQGTAATPYFTQQGFFNIGLGYSF